MFNNINTKYVNWAFILLCCFLAVLTLEGLKNLHYIGKDIYPQSSITVTGEGESYAIPDIATFSFSVVETGATVKDAQAKVDAKIDKALSSVKDAGVEDKDVKTVDYSVYPKYEWSQVTCIRAPCPPGRNVLTGYEVNETISIKIRDTSKAGDLVTQVGAMGASNISGLEFTVDDRDQYVAEARKQAIEKAKANAEKMADDLGVHLGKVISFNEGGNYPTPYMGMDAKAGMVQETIRPANLPQGESKIVSSVSITYEIR